MPEDLSAVDPSISDLLGGVIGPAGIVIAGIGPPQIPATGIPPLDGVHDPWRPIDEDGDWVSQFYAVSWEADATIPTSGPDGLGVGTSWLLPGADQVGNLTPTWEEYFATQGPNIAPGNPPTFTDAGSGIVGLSFYNATNPPNSSIDPTDFMGAGVTIIGTYEFPEPTEAVAIPGPDGAYYADLTDLGSPVFYGPKTAGNWGEGG